jgi:hypothetical protein
MPSCGSNAAACFTRILPGKSACAAAFEDNDATAAAALRLPRFAVFFRPFCLLKIR